MRRLREFAVVVLTAGCIPCPSDEAKWTDASGTADGLLPFRAPWETVVEYPIGPAGLTRITIGGLEIQNNFVNRGDVEVYFVDTARPVAGFASVDHVIVQTREFTFSIDEADAAADFETLVPFVYPGPVDPAWWIEPGSECNPRDPETGEVAVDGTCEANGTGCGYDSDCAPADTCVASSVFGFRDDCEIRVYWKGQAQKTRVGADIRVFLPRSFEGLVTVVTEDNLREDEAYPDRGDVTILDLAGSARVEVGAGRVNIRLADGIEPAPECDAATQVDCLGMGWAPSLPCASACQDFGRVGVRTRGQQAPDVRVDAPADLWMTAKLANTGPGVTPADGCVVEIDGVVPTGAPADCGVFGGCDCLACGVDDLSTRVEINKPGPDSIPGLGYQVDLESNDCTMVEFVDEPEDVWAAKAELRGSVGLCDGCLDSMRIPVVP